MTRELSVAVKVFGKLHKIGKGYTLSVFYMMMTDKPHF